MLLERRDGIVQADARERDRLERIDAAIWAASTRARDGELFFPHRAHALGALTREPQL